jgi:hypothetical protein
MDPETKKDLDEQAMVRRFEDDFEADMQARYETQHPETQHPSEDDYLDPYAEFDMPAVHRMMREDAERRPPRP